MDKYVVVVFAIFIGTSLCSRPMSYRSDYEYNRDTNAFYKLHTESRRGWLINAVCQVEGASLMVPTNEADIVQVHGMFKKYPDLGPYLWVASDGQDHESAEEPALITLTDPEEDNSAYRFHTCEVLTRSGDIETYPCFQELPFVCKVEAKDAPHDLQCDVFANNYQYNATLGSCYKIPQRVASWNEAYAECRAEGAHLVVLNSETERDGVQRLMLEAPKVLSSQASWYFHAGFRTTKPVGNETMVWRTLFDQTLSEAGLEDWSTGEPNNARGDEYCGCLFKNNGKMNDASCDSLFAFICEKEVPASA